ncbi:MAG: aldolase/citrate lyase family protein [Ignavibacteriales bacterium]|nr:aldolase/citrate lyase family protein [Ignavibacteriales bacterium]
MKLRIKKYHFAKATNDKIQEFARSIFELDAVLCFDLEDIVRDLPGKKAEKKMHRAKVKSSIESIVKYFVKPKVGIRINVFGSKEFYNDIETLESIKSGISLDCIFLPKIESGEEIQKCSEILKNRKIEFLEIIPIIESKKAFNDLEKIIISSKNFTNKLAFGHCDYNYNNGYFPFYHQDSEKYWEWINFIMSVSEVYNILFINSPYLRLNNDSSFLYMLNRLGQRTNGIFGQITLSLNQVRLCSLHECNSLMNTTFINKNEFKIIKKDIAKKIIKEYEANITKDRSFAMNKENRIIISPQEYLAAEKYLIETSALDASKN